MGIAVAVIVVADLLVIGFCVLYLTRAGDTLTRHWTRQRETLENVRSALERLVGEAEARAREFEQLLGVREKHLRTLLRELAEGEDRVRQAQESRGSGRSARPTLAEDARRLAATGLGAMEVARTLAADPAEVRLVLELEGGTARAASVRAARPPVGAGG
jgi:hypothetical protein